MSKLDAHVQDLLRERLPNGPVTIIQNYGSVNQMVVGQENLIDSSTTIIKQFDPEMAKLLLKVGQCGHDGVQQVVNVLKEQLAAFYQATTADKPAAKRALMDRARDLVDLGHKVATSAPWLCQVTAKIMEGIKGLAG